MLSQDNLKDMVQDILQHKDSQLFLVDLLLSDSKTGRKIVVYIDGDQGVSIDTFAEISRAVSARLDEENLIEDQYVLEVSSPGLDQPLRSERQYRKNIGRQLKITLQDGKTVKGKLLQVSAAEVIIDEETKQKNRKTTAERVIPFDQIKKTNVLASFK